MSMMEFDSEQFYTERDYEQAMLYNSYGMRSERVYRNWVDGYSYLLYEDFDSRSELEEYLKIFESFSFSYQKHPIMASCKCDLDQQLIFFAHRRYFKTNVFEELIQTALHPSRIQKQLNQFDDVESFFEAIGC